MDTSAQVNRVNLTDVDMHKKSLFRELFGIRKKATARQRKMRQNRRLDRILVPKDAFMVLHEMKGIRTRDIAINKRMRGEFTANVFVDNIQYEGYGSSKLSAKNNVCENALRDLVISKMIQNPSRPNSKEQIDAMQIDDDEEDDQIKELNEDESDVPMINLVSFALYKLFSKWKKEEFNGSEFCNQGSSNNSNSQQVESAKKSPTIRNRNELPQQWEGMHPATLLCMMRPNIAYVDLGCKGSRTTPTQKIGVAVDGENFIGLGRSKKIARRNAACLACNKLFGTIFKKEEEF